MCLITFQGSIVNETNPENSLEGLMLKLKPQYCGHLMRRADSLEKTLKLGKIEGRRRRGRQDDVVGWHHWLNGVWASSERWWRTREPGVLQSMGSQRVGHDWAAGGSAASSVPCSILLAGWRAGLQNGLRLHAGSLFSLLSLVLSTLTWHTDSQEVCTEGIIQQRDKQASERI